MNLPDYIDPEALKAIDYNPCTGEFYRVVKTSHNSQWRADRPAYNGYRRVCVGGRKYWAHRLAWFMNYGEWPPEEIDHINGDRSDNRIGNLRLADRAQNCMNVRTKVGKTGYRGVHKQSHTSRFRAAISVLGKNKHIGYFATAELAHAAVVEAMEKYRGEFSPLKKGEQ